MFNIKQAANKDIIGRCDRALNQQLDENPDKIYNNLYSFYTWFYNTVNDKTFKLCLTNKPEHYRIPEEFQPETAKTLYWRAARYSDNSNIKFNIIDRTSVKYSQSRINAANLQGLFACLLSFKNPDGEMKEHEYRERNTDKLHYIKAPFNCYVNDEFMQFNFIMYQKALPTFSTGTENFFYAPNHNPIYIQLNFDFSLQLPCLKTPELIKGPYNWRTLMPFFENQDNKIPEEIINIYKIFICNYILGADIHL